ncbi:MAG: proteasome subunit alpha [Actinobacteria bacterium]|nr:proteasome subunit alpha [Actinomycetota bacterium]
MSMPFYVAPEQVMKDRADYARKGIARGRSLVGLRFADGILVCAENPSNTLRKISEIYDRIAFAGVGRYNEFDQLRIAGVRHADLKGYSFSREDVDARGLANSYAGILGQIFTHEMKPLEVEILVAEVGVEPAGDQLFHLLYDGTVLDEHDFSVLGGDAEAISERMSAAFADGLDLGRALATAVAALSGPDRTLSAAELEVALLERGSGRRFRRLDDATVAQLLGPDAAGEDDGGEPVAAVSGGDVAAGRGVAGATARTQPGDEPAPAPDGGAGDEPSDEPSDGAGDDAVPDDDAD